MKPPIDFDWEEEIEEDIESAMLDDEWEGWISPLQSLGVDDRWIIQLSEESLENIEYRKIQSDDNSRFEEYWNEKMKRQRDGIE